MPIGFWSLIVSPKYSIMMSSYKKGDDIMPSTGEKPGKGTYTCDNCGQVIVLDDDSDTMPPCPKCSGTEFH